MTEQGILELIRTTLTPVDAGEPHRFGNGFASWLLNTAPPAKSGSPSLNALTDALKPLTETQNRFRTSWEAVSRLWEAVRENTEQISRLWQSLDALREEISLMRQTYESAIARLEQSFVRLDQTVARLDAEIQLLKQAMETGFERVHPRITALGTRWGLENEKAFWAGLKGILEQRFGMTATQWRHYDKQGFVFGTPTWVEANVLIHNGEHLLVEVKAHVSRGDISEFRRLGQFCEQVTGIKSRLIIVSPFVDLRAADLAQLWNIAIYEELEDVPTEGQGGNGQ